MLSAFRNPIVKDGMTLEELRTEIDQIDEHLLTLLNARARCVAAIGEIKRREQTAVLVPDRERQLLAKLTALNSGPLPDEMVVRLFQQIIDTLKELQR